MGSAVASPVRGAATRRSAPARKDGDGLRWASITVAATILAVCLPNGNRWGAALSGTPSVTPADVLSAFVVLAAAVALLAGRRLAPAWPWWALAASGVGVGVATVASTDPDASLIGFVRYGQAFIAIPIAVALLLRRRSDVWLVLGALLTAAAVQAAVGGWQYITKTGASFAGQDVRAVGTFGAAEVMGMATVVGYGLVVAVGLALVLGGRARILLVLVATTLAGAMLLSLSRGSVLAVAVAVAVMVLTANPRLAAAISLAAVTAAILLATVGGVARAPERDGAGVAARFGSIGSSATSPDRSVQDRYDLWHAALEMWRDRPLTGVGPRQFPAYRDSYAPLSLSSGSDVADASIGFRREPLLSPHNMYLLVLSEQGAAGAISFAMLLLGLTVAAIRRAVATRRGPPGDRLSPQRSPAQRPRAQQLPAKHLVGFTAAGLLLYTAVMFGYGDIGGSTTVVTAVVLGLGLWAVLPGSAEREAR